MIVATFESIDERHTEATRRAAGLEEKSMRGDTMLVVRAGTSRDRVLVALDNIRASIAARSAHEYEHLCESFESAIKREPRHAR